MRIYKEQDYTAVSRRTANLISAQIIAKPDSVIGLATGSSPIGAYKQLIEWYKKGDLDFNEVISVNLDEYVGLTQKDPQSYHYFMKEHLFSFINIKSENTHIPNGTAKNSAEACKNYDAFLESIGGTDLQLLGIGQNGHIGFNEPGKYFEKNTHVVNLTRNTIEANSRLFEHIEDVPKKAITMGIQTILQAAKIVLVVTGKEKAKAVYQSIMEPITPSVPASILQLHKDVSIVGDLEALSLIPEEMCTVIPSRHL